jgi:hypothetical protein
MTGRTDPDTIIRCHNMCAYYVEKCPDVWSRLEPLLIEVLGLPIESGESSHRLPFQTCG